MITWTDECYQPNGMGMPCTGDRPETVVALAVRKLRDSIRLGIHKALGSRWSRPLESARLHGTAFGVIMLWVPRLRVPGPGMAVIAYYKVRNPGTDLSQLVALAELPPEDGSERTR
jgi:hypothetical protein